MESFNRRQPAFEVRIVAFDDVGGAGAARDFQIAEQVFPAAGNVFENVLQESTASCPLLPDMLPAFVDSLVVNALFKHMQLERIEEMQVAVISSHLKQLPDVFQVMSMA